MKNHKTLQEFAFTSQPAAISGGVDAGKTEIQLQGKFTPAKMEGDKRVAPARLGTKHHAAMALMLFHKNPCIVEGEKLDGLCILRTEAGLHSGRITSHHAAQESMRVVIADLKPLGGRNLAWARLAVVKRKLAQKYAVLVSKCGSQGRKVVLGRKLLGFNTVAQALWQKVFRALAAPAAAPAK